MILWSNESMARNNEQLESRRQFATQEPPVKVILNITKNLYKIKPDEEEEDCVLS